MKQISKQKDTPPLVDISNGEVSFLIIFRLLYHRYLYL